LRFPGFQGEWVEKRLKDVADYITKRVSSSLLSVNNYVSTENLLQDFQGVVPAFSIPSNTNVVSYKQNDILFSNIRPYLRKVWKANSDGGCSSDVFVFRNKEGCSSTFLYYSIANVKFIDYVMAGAKGVKMPRGDKQQIQQYPILLPLKFEQEKIAIFLSLLDDRIATQNKIIEQYKSLIKGMSEKLFSEEIRFKEFSEIWQLNTLGKALIKNSTKNRKQKHSIVQSVSNKYGFINQDEIFEDRRVASVNTSNYYVIKKGYFAYNPSRINIGSLAYKNDDEVSVISPLYISFKANNDFLVDYFLWYWFTTNGFTQQMNNLFEGSVRNTLSYESLIRMIIPIPSTKEQTKIAGFLLSIEEKIETEKQLLKKYTEQKKYLLTNMFV